MEQIVVKCLVTGGPVGGKTDGIPLIKAALEEDGWLVLVSVEASTKLTYERSYYVSGPRKNTSLMDFQRLILKEEIEQEELLMKRASESGAPKVFILCDRGRFDGLGYVPHEEFYKMAKEEFGQSKDDLFDYDGCVFLLSPAVDKPEIYLEHMRNNPARREMSIESGIRQNDASLDACRGIGRMFIVDNSTPFDEKIARAIKIVKHFVASEEHERKFARKDGMTLDKAQAINIFTEQGMHSVIATISQQYLILTDDDRAKGMKTRRVRHSSLEDLSSGGKYILALKGPKTEGGELEDEKKLSHGEYVEHLKKADPTRGLIGKHRFYFIFDYRYWELDVFMCPAGQRFLLEYEHLPGEDLSKLKVPPYFGELDDVTDNPGSSNQNIAKLA